MKIWVVISVAAVMMVGICGCDQKGGNPVSKLVEKAMGVEKEEKPKEVDPRDRYKELQTQIAQKSDELVVAKKFRAYEDFNQVGSLTVKKRCEKCGLVTITELNSCNRCGGRLNPLPFLTTADADKLKKENKQKIQTLQNELSNLRQEAIAVEKKIKESENKKQ